MPASLYHWLSRYQSWPLPVADEQRRLQQQEEHAVEAEDFEQAADLSTRLDALNARVSQLTDDLRAAEADCERTSAFHCLSRRHRMPSY